MKVTGKIVNTGVYPEYLGNLGRSVRAAEFFAGIGLVRLALEGAGWKVVFANDISPQKLQMYRLNFCADHFVLGDIAQVEPQQVPEVDLVTASFPCIDLSLAGNRAGLEGTHSSAFWVFARLLKRVEPRPNFVLIENVPGLLSSHEGRDLSEVVAFLNRLEYSCDILQVDAAHFLPQSRPRLFIVGRSPMTRFGMPMPSRHAARPSSIIDFVVRHPALDWDFAELPPLPKRKKSLSDIVESYPAEHPIWWNSVRKAHLASQMSSKHRNLLSFFAGQKQPVYLPVYKRVRAAGCMAELRFDGIAGCLRTPRGGSSKQFLIEAGGGDWRVRNMTPREYGRLQGVGSSFKLHANENVSLYGFGDAVCVPAVKWVIQATINAALSNDEDQSQIINAQTCAAY